MYVNMFVPYKTVTEVIKKLRNPMPLLNRIHVTCIVRVHSFNIRGSGRRKTYVCQKHEFPSLLNFLSTGCHF